jgi:hypothetical protein
MSFLWNMTTRTQLPETNLHLLLRRELRLRRMNLDEPQPCTIFGRISIDDVFRAGN